MKKNLQEKFKPRPPLPQTSTPFNTEIKDQQKKWSLTFLIFLLVSSFYTYFYIEHKQESERLVKIYIAKENFKFPHVLEDSDLNLEIFPLNKLPQGVFFEKDQKKLIGKTLIQNMVAQEIFLPHHTQPDLNPESVSSKFNEAFALSMDEDWFQAKFPNLKENDLIDILVSNPEDNLEATVTVASQMKVIDIQESSHKKTIIINTTEVEARGILFSRGLRLPMQILVRSGISH